MPEFQLDTSGSIDFVCDVGSNVTLGWDNFDAFTQGYVEALFFTSNAQGVQRACEWQTTENGLEFRDDDGDWVIAEGAFPENFTFSDLAPEALQRIITDCAKFQAIGSPLIARCIMGPSAPKYTKAGRDFWYTRNGHGCGFNDGDWPEPYAAQLTDAAHQFGEVDAYLGDDGKVYLS